MPATNVAPRRSARLLKAQAALAPVAAPKAPAKPVATRQKRKAASPTATSASSKSLQQPKKIRKTGLTSAVTDTSAPLGVVDPEANVKGHIVSHDNEPCDAMLVLVDPAKSMDKFFILQLIEKQNKRVKKGKFVVYTRWGRTGTKGQAQLTEYNELDDAIAFFESKFEDKTGLIWIDRNNPTKGNKYRFIRQDFSQKQNGYTAAKWQYWVDDGVDGKADGWYDYDVDASKLVEQLFHEHSQNRNIAGRSIDSGMYAYDVDLDQMVQTNVRHPNRTERRIRRNPAGSNLDNSPPSPVLSSSPPAVVPSTPVNPPKSTTAATVSPPTPPAVTSLAPGTATVKSSPLPAVVSSAAAAMSPPAKKTGGSHPVDPDISVKGQRAEDYQVVQDDNGLWYDAVLNQCNIGQNNNKYYRLQCLESKHGYGFYAWFRWGRVGEPTRAGASTWTGPFPTLDGAARVFCKKYRDKTANTFGEEPFVPQQRKYTLIEIDNDVEVDDDFKIDPVQTKDVEYAPSTLDKKTEDLVSVLFSEDMRNEALTSFNLDLKRLPLGVPSQQQINRGIDILAKIEKKLNGDTSVYDSYQSLSSQFYTAIPHSFGRTVPPIIRCEEALRSRYDMCNILLDMFDTNETVRRIAKEQKQEAEKTSVLPNPIDQHYKSLQADLRIVDRKSMEFETIKECFLKTGGQSGRSQLLDVWAVNREGESERFEKFDSIDNRCLLWHGTNIAVVAPIITSGLRIMPHSGGRVGSGIYLASMQEKSAQYTSGYGAKFACMFLCEAPLGKQHPVTSDGSHASGLRKAPKGFDSVHAKGRIQPKKWANMTIDGKKVKVPQGGCKDESSNQGSSFYHDEFLVYEEAQVRLRYILTVKL